MYYYLIIKNRHIVERYQTQNLLYYFENIIKLVRSHIFNKHKFIKYILMIDMTIQQIHLLIYLYLSLKINTLKPVSIHEKVISKFLISLPQ